MRKLLILLIPFLLGAAPSRQATYTAGEAILSTDVTANEDAIFNYLQAGVDTIKDASVVNADISTSANIQCSKINVTACSQNITNTGTFSNTGNVTFTGDLDISVDLAVLGTVAIPRLSGAYSNKQAALCVGVDGTLFAQDGGCN